MKNVTIWLFLLSPVGCLSGQSSEAGLENLLDLLGVAADPRDLPPAPLPGFLEVVRGAEVLYVSRDGSLLVDGEILSVATRVNLTEQSRAAVRRRLIEHVPRAQRIVVPAIDPVRARIVVFADTDCPYCLKLHRQRQEFSRRGIEVHYLFYPRSGPSGESFAQAVAVWCAADRLAALDSVLRGATLPAAECEHPVMEHYELARQLKLKGTPAAVDAAGGIRYGVIGAEELSGVGPRPLRSTVE